MSGRSWLQSFAIITTQPNELIAKIHDRMPAILRERDYDRWLDRGIAEQPPLDLLRPYDAEEMDMRPANPKVGNVCNNGPDMLVCSDSWVSSAGYLTPRTSMFVRSAVRTHPAAPVSLRTPLAAGDHRPSALLVPADEPRRSGPNSERVRPPA